MALFRKFFYRKPPDGLLEISERVFVFDCCFTTDILEDDEYKVYIGGIVGQLREHFLDASFMVFNFREGEKQSQIANILSEYDMTVMDYPRQYEGCPLLTMEMIHHFLRSGESWLSLGQQNILLMHCERGGWPILAFMLAALLIYRKQFTVENKTLDMVYKQAPRELLQLMSPLNPLPSQLRYLQYISRRNVGSEWPPLDRALTLDCIILRVIPNMDGEGGFRPIFRIYGQDPFMAADRTPKVLFSTPKRSKLVRHYKQADCELVKIDINCHVQGDVVLECISLNSEQERESMMFRVMFNTAFIRSNILMLNRDEIDILWDAKDQFPKEFRAEVIFSEMDSATSLVSIDLPSVEEKDGLPVEAFAKVQEIFNNVYWPDPKADVALNVLQRIKASDVLQEDLETAYPQTAALLELTFGNVKEKLELKAANDDVRCPTSMVREEQPVPSFKPSMVANSIQQKIESHELQVQQPAQSKTMSPQKASNDNVRSPTSMVEEEQSIASFEPSIDANSVQKKIESHELQVAIQQPAQSKIISARVSQTSLPSPTSPAPVSRYQSVPSALGITALLHDHAASKCEEVAHPLISILPSSTISSPPVTKIPKSVHVPTLSSPPPPPPPPPPAPPAHMLQSSMETSRTVSSAPHPPPTPATPAQPTSKTTDNSLTQCSGSTGGGVQSLSVPPMPPPLPFKSGATSTPTTMTPCSTPPLPPPPPSFSGASPSPPVSSPPPPALSFSGASPSLSVKNSFSPSPPALPVPEVASCAATTVSSSLPTKDLEVTSRPPPPPPPPLSSRSVSAPTIYSAPQPPPPPPPSLASKGPLSNNSTPVLPVPPPLAPLANGKEGTAFPQSNSGISNGHTPSVPGPPSVPFSAKARGLSRPTAKSQAQTRKANLKPYHWLKLTRAVQGSLWAETQKSDEASKAPEFDISELESLFSAAVPNSNQGNMDGKSNRRVTGSKSEKIQLIELRRAYNCEIMLTKVKAPLPDLMNSVLALDNSALDVDQVDNLIKFCPTKEEMELLKGYKGDKENLGKCEQFFLELMKVPRVESKLRVFSFKIQFRTQVSDLRNNLKVVNSAAEEVRNSAKLKSIMQTILSLGNALNHGTARGSAIGFRLDSLLKLTDTRARNNKMTLMHYLCKVLAEKLPELLDFPKDLVSLEAANKIQLKCLAEEMQAVSKGLEKVVQEFAASENDGPVSENFCTNLKEFLSFAEGEVRSLASLYSNVGRSADALALYFGEDPARCPFEQVVSTLLNFVRMFVRAHEENCKQIELEKKKAQKEAENEKLKGVPKKESKKLMKALYKDNGAERNCVL